MQNSIKGRVTSNISQIPFYKDVENKTANIQPQSNYIYGELSEKVIRPVYEAVDTPTLDLTIDNETKTIRGDVLIKEFMGETPDKVYPGHLGKRNYELILGLNASLKELLKNYNIFSTSIKSQLQIFKVDIGELSSKINDEIIRSKNVDSVISDQIDEINKVLESLEQDILQKLDIIEAKPAYNISEGDITKWNTASTDASNALQDIALINDTENGILATSKNYIDTRELAIIGDTDTENTVKHAEAQAQKGIEAASLVQTAIDTLEKGAVKTNADNITTIQTDLSNNVVKVKTTVEGSVAKNELVVGSDVIIFDCGASIE